MEFTSHFPDCFPLWHEAFGDSRDTVTKFLTTVPNRPFFAVEDGQLLSMLFAVPQAVGCHKAAYLYAVATVKRARGQGLAAQLLRYAEEALKQDGFAACLLSPAKPELAAWYMRQDYEYWGTWQSISAKNRGGNPVSPEEYLLLREKKLQNVPHNTPPKEVLALYTLTDSGAWEGIRPVELLSEHAPSPAPVMYKALQADFPETGYFSFVMD